MKDDEEFFQAARPLNAPTSRMSHSVSISFWITLFAAASLYAFVALSPRLARWTKLRNDFYGNQVRLVSLETRVRALDRIIDELESDPQFAAQVARMDFGAMRDGDEIIPVGSRLSLQWSATTPADPLPRMPARWYQPLVDRIARPGTVRSASLVVSALLVIFAFAGLHDANGRRLSVCVHAVRRVFLRFVRRYVNR